MATVKFNDKDEEIELDSGTPRTMVNDEIAKKHEWKLEPIQPFRRYAGAGGGPLNVIGSCKVLLGIGEWTKQVEILVTKGLQVNGLLGTDVMGSNRMTVCYDLMLLKVQDKGQVAIRMRADQQRILAVVEYNGVTEEQKSKFKTMLNEFEYAFSKDDYDIGSAENLMHDIELVEDAKPFKSYSYRPAYKHREIVENHVRDMLKMGVIRPSTSNFTSPVVLAPKGDGSLRFCIDFRPINKITKKDHYPLPLIEEKLNELVGSQFFTSLDLTSGYWQFGLTERSIPLTAFVCQQGVFEFTRMPFGLVNAGCTFQREMERLLWDVRGFCTVYVDDIMIFSANFDDHIDHVRAVLIILSRAGLKIKMRKCHFALNQCKFLGYLVDGQGVRMDPEKVKAIEEYQAPKSIKQLRRFNGLTSHYRQFVPDYVSLNVPLQQAALVTILDPVSKRRVSNTFKWTPECQTAFEVLKSILCSEPILVYPDLTKRFRVITDASGIGLGAVLAQVIDGEEKVNFYAGRVLAKAEKNYHTTERELLAVKWAVKKFRCYLHGQEFDVFTDHKPLCHVKTSKGASERMLKWILELEEQAITYHYRPGKYNIQADFLSRLYEEPSEPVEWYKRKKSLETLRENFLRATTRLQLEDGEQEGEEEQLEVVLIVVAQNWKEELAAAQKADEELKRMWKSGKLECLDGLVYMVSRLGNQEETRRLVVPGSRVKEVLGSCHNGLGGGHFGYSKTLQKIASRFYWNKMSASVRKWVEECEECSQRKTSRRREGPKLQSFPGVDRPFERIAVDFIGPLPTSSKGNSHILVFVDYATRWPEAFATRNQLAVTVAELFVDHILCRHGAPGELLSDQGRNFLSKVIQEICQVCRTRKIQTPAYSPKVNGLCERFNSTLVQTLAILARDNQQRWDIMIPMALFAYRTSVQESAKFTPARLLYGRELRLPLDIDLIHLNQPFSQEFKKLWQKARLNVEKVAKYNKDRHDERTKPIVYTVGQRIRLKIHTAHKLSGYQWSEPVAITKVCRSTVEVMVKNQVKVISMDHIKPVAEKCD